MAKAFGDTGIYFQKAGDDELSKRKAPKTKKGGKSDMYKMRLLKLRKFNEQDQKEYVGVDDIDNSYIANYDNGDVVISKTTDGYLVSKFPIDTENDEGDEKNVTSLSEAIDVALQYKDDLDKAKSPEEIMYKKIDKSSRDDKVDIEKAVDDEVNPFEMAEWGNSLTKAELDEFEKAKHQDGDMHPNGKWVWRQSANGGKGDWRVANPKRGGGARKTAVTSSVGSQKTDGKTDGMKEKQAQDGNQPKSKIELVKNMRNTLLEYARKINRDFNTTVKAQGETYDVYVSNKRGKVTVYDDDKLLVYANTQRYRDALMSAYTKIQNLTTQKTDDTKKSTSTTVDSSGNKSVLSQSDKTTIKNIVTKMFGYYNVEKISFKDDALKVIVEGKAYGDGYSVWNEYDLKDGKPIAGQYDGDYTKSRLNELMKKLGEKNLKKFKKIILDEDYD